MLSSEPGFGRIPGGPFVILGGLALHLAAGLREAARDRGLAPPAAGAPWQHAAIVEDIAEDCAVVVRPPDGEAVAIFRHKGRLSAVTNLCAHQNGPLGEARVVDGCITCPWHGFQDRLEDGRAPPPYTERLATYRLRLEGRRVLLDPRPNPARHAGGTGARAAMKPVLP